MEKYKTIVNSISQKVTASIEEENSLERFCVSDAVDGAGAGLDERRVQQAEFCHQVALLGRLLSCSRGRGLVKEESALLASLITLTTLPRLSLQSQQVCYVHSAQDGGIV